MRNSIPTRTWETPVTDPSEDDRLAARLGALFLQEDPPPPAAIELARQSFVLRNLDGDLAALVEDSESDDPASVFRSVAVRGTGTAPETRQLTFLYSDGVSGDELLIAVQVESSGPSRRLTGQLSPEGPALIEVRQPGTSHVLRAEADDGGAFVVEDVRPGPISLTCRRAGGVTVATQWTRLR